MSDIHNAGEEIAEQITDSVVETPIEPADGPGSGRSGLRKQLEKNFDADRKAADAVTAKKAPAKAGKRVAGGAEITPEPAEGAEVVEEAAGEAEATPKTAAPEAFSKEAKAEWAKTPAAVQAAILKRETDTAKGVEELKGKYKELDSSLAPHMSAIRQHGHTPAQAVSQLFGWFQALAANPDVAFPALAKSFSYDLAKIAPQPAATTAAVDPNAQPGQQPAGVIPPELQKYITDLQAEVGNLKNTFAQELTGLKGTFQQQSEAKTNEILANWSKDKPHFESVRGLMAQLIQSGAVPLKDGQVDLDGAYDMALYANPEIRAKVLAEQQAAAAKERKAKVDAAAAKQAAEVEKARKAGVSLGGGAPGEPGAAPGGKKGKGKSVRESIMEAREQLTE